MKKKWLVSLLVLLVAGYIACTDNKAIELSGTLQDGLRWVTLDTNHMAKTLHFYRGDYVRFLLTGKSTGRLKIPVMDVDVSLPLNDPEHPYIKFKAAGNFPFSLDNKQGTIVVHEYVKTDYRELTSGEAQVILKDLNPLILDVRMPYEYNSGHLKEALLIPVQELQRRVTELNKFKDKPIFIYCATGNRSTVAAKILQDNGFKKIYNLRHGIVGWIQDGYSIVK